MYMPLVCISVPSCIPMVLRLCLLILSLISWIFCSWSLTIFSLLSTLFSRFYTWSLRPEILSLQCSNLLVMLSSEFLIWIFHFRYFLLVPFQNLSLLKCSFFSYVFSLSLFIISSFSLSFIFTINFPSLFLACPLLWCPWGQLCHGLFAVAYSLDFFILLVFLSVF